MAERVLLVDDDEPIREIMSLVIADLGYPVATVAGGDEALAAIPAFRPSIVLTDIKMPGMDGIELLKRIKARDPDIEVIMISGHGDMDLVVQSLQNEALDFITKPIRDPLLVSALNRAAEKISMRRQIREHTENLERIVKEKSAKLVELERQLAVGQVVEGLSSAMKGLAASFDEGPAYFNELPCFIAIHNRFLEIVAANQLYRERLGDLVGHHSWEAYLGREGSGNACPVMLTVSTKTGQRSRETLVDAQGRSVPVIVHTAPILNQEGEVELVIEISVDVTEVARLQEDLRQARERFARLFDAVPSFVCVVDRSRRILETNRAFREEFGECRQEVCHQALAHSEEPCPDCAYYRLPGEHDAPLDPLSPDTWPAWETVLTGRTGKHHVLMRQAPIVDEAGRVTALMEVATDITQIRDLQDHLASLGLMLGSMSHGVKGLLTSLDGGVYKVEAGLRRDDPDKLRAGWDIVRDKIGRIRTMVMDILYYAKSRELERAPVDLAEFGKSLADIVGPKAQGRGVGFSLVLADGLPSLHMDESALSAGLVNLLENAVDACAEDDAKTGHEVSLSVGIKDERAVFVIKDNGIGMDQPTREKMFTLFFSSKGSRGTGLGLFIANQVVERHGGDIRVDSEPGQGSRFTLTLPLDGPQGTAP